MSAQKRIAAYAKKFEPLTNDEEKELVVLIQDGDMDARDKLVRHNMLYALGIANRWVKNPRFNRHEDDIVQGAIIGLQAAADKYDGRIRFAAYARRSIDWAISEELGPMMSHLSVPQRTATDSKRVMWAYGECLKEHYGPTNEDVWEKLNKKVGRGNIAAVLHGLRFSVCDLDRVMHDGTTNENHDVTQDEFAEPPDMSIECEMVKNTIASALYSLTDQQRHTIERVFGVNGVKQMTTQEVADEDGVTHQAISFRVKRILCLLRGGINGSLGDKEDFF